MVEVIVTCSKLHRFWSEKGKTAYCRKCRKYVQPPRNSHNNAQFDQFTRKTLKAPFGSDADRFSSARDVDRSLREIQAKYPHFPGLA